MCGITGFWKPELHDGLDLSVTVRTMANTLVHRGPDAGGVWVDADAGVALGHRRLAIVDLSPTGHQPMLSQSGRYAIVLNGEVYNFCELRRQLEQKGHAFRGTSDTEVMLAAFEEWGVPDSVPRFNGMFAFAVWDRRGRTLFCARDRMGEKPLYFGYAGGTFLFASELKALLRYPGFQPEIDRGALASYLRHTYIPAPSSIYQGVQKLLPGCILQLRQGSAPAITPYWSLKEVARRGTANPLSCSPEDAVNQLDDLLRDAVRLQMVADVPLGAFLSGGFDSSTVVGAMQAQKNAPVRTFSIGFEEEQFDEARYAKAVAAHLGTDHTELYVTAKEAMEVIPKLPCFYDEPFADSSQIPTYLVSRLARQAVTVSLSGDGGDELFGGYRMYLSGLSVERFWRRIPYVLRRSGAWALDGMVRSGLLDNWMGKDGKYVGAGPMTKRLTSLAAVLRLKTREELYRHLLSRWRSPAELLAGVHEPLTAFSDPSRQLDFENYLETMEYVDMGSYLPDDILVKVDRAAMAVSIESRVPLLDHRLVEFSWRIPVSFKLKDGQGKWLLRQLAYRYVPRELLDRPKKGFSVPVDRWICGPLREWAEALLDERRLRAEGIFNPKPIRRAWHDHLSGIKNSNEKLWAILMYQSWQEAQHSARSAPTTPLTSLGVTR